MEDVMAGSCISWVQEIFVIVTKIFREDTPLEVYNVYCMPVPVAARSGA